MNAASDQGVLNAQWNAAQAWLQAAIAHTRPSVLFRPRLFLDGDMWCALYGENLMDGCAGFGKTPDAAMENFDLHWRTMQPPPKAKEKFDGGL